MNQVRVAGVFLPAIFWCLKMVENGGSVRPRMVGFNTSVLITHIHRHHTQHTHQGLHTTITVCLSAICATSLKDFLCVRLDHLVGIPAEFRNCLTVDALIPKFTF